MGIITKLSFEQIENHISTEYGLKLLAFDECESGVSDTVYSLRTNGGVYILKLFENAEYVQIKAERELLASLAPLPVVRTFGDITKLCGKPCALYEAARGLHPSDISELHIKKIGEFLASMHALTASLTSKNPPFAAVCAAKKQDCIGSPFERYAYLFDEMAQLPVDGVIHGDLFPDNLFFEGNELSCVIDFIEAFSGSFVFELGVVAFAFGARWIPALAASYGRYSEDEILHHARYAALFYGVGRFLGGRDHEECLSFLRSHC